VISEHEQSLHEGQAFFWDICGIGQSDHENEQTLHEGKSFQDMCSFLWWPEIFIWDWIRLENHYNQ
jgi:hypothetical protein